MKKNMICWAILVVFMMVSISGCIDVYSAAKTIYTGTKALVTDEEIRPMIPDATMDRLALAEQGYLRAVRLKELKDDDHTSLELLVACAEEILGIIDDLNLAKEHGDSIEKIRIGIKTLKSIIQAKQ